MCGAGPADFVVASPGNSSAHFQDRVLGGNLDDPNSGEKLPHPGEVIPLDLHRGLSVRPQPEFTGGLEDRFRLFPLGFLRESGNLRLRGFESQFRVAQDPVLRLENGLRDQFELFDGKDTSRVTSPGPTRFGLSLSTTSSWL